MTSFLTPVALVFALPVYIVLTSAVLAGLLVVQLFPSRVRSFVNYELHRAFHRMYPDFIRAPRER
jgi:hypothetical protein